MRRCVLCGRWLLLAFQVEGGSLCVRRRVSGWGGEGANEAARLVWLLGPAGFPEGSGEKSISSSSRQNRGSLSIELLPACPRATAHRRGMMNTPDRGSIGEWFGRRERCMAVRECCLRPLHRFPSPRAATHRRSQLSLVHPITAAGPAGAAVVSTEHPPRRAPPPRPRLPRAGLPCLRRPCSLKRLLPCCCCCCCCCASQEWRPWW